MSKILTPSKELFLKYGVYSGAIAPTRGLISHWPGKMNGNTVIDLLGERHGTAYNVTTTPGKRGDALNFNGSDAYVDFTSYDFSGDATLAFWIYLKAAMPAGPAAIVMGDGYALGAGTLSNKIRIWKYSAPDKSYNFSFNEWHLVIYKKIGSTVYLKIDNAVIESWSNPANFGIWKFGRHFWNGTWRYTNGYLNLVRLYEVATTDVEDTMLWNYGNAI